MPNSDHAAVSTLDPPEQGQLVAVRQRRYVVSEVNRSVLPPMNPTRIASSSPQTLVTLSSIEDDALGEELQVVWELEPGAQVHEKASIPEPSSFDLPHRLDAFLNAVKWGVISKADYLSIQSPFRSGIEIEDYQLDPVIRAVRMPRVNLLLADDVGLGKTIEAGLVIQELIIRHRARKVLIVCPASLLIQWRDQMRDKFGLEFRIVDSGLFRELRRSRGIHVNPWSHFPRLITSIDFIKREKPYRLLRELLPAEGEAIYPRKFDILVVDEAHNVAPSGRGQYAIDSQRTAAIRGLTPHFEHKLFLSATPHNGYRESFTAFLELLDSQRFARGIDPDPKQLQTIMIRRLKSEFEDWDSRKRFPPRRLEPIEVEHTAGEKEIHQHLQRYTRSRTEKVEDAGEKTATEFVLKLLKKRLFSSPAAFQKTLAKHIESISSPRDSKKAARKVNPRILRDRIEGTEEDFADDDEREVQTDELVSFATENTGALSGEESDLLKRMKAWADDAIGRPDSKTRQLIGWLKTHIKPGGKWSNERVIIFTEYRATQNWLHQILAGEGFTQGGRLQTLYGGMDSDAREQIKAAFQADPDTSEIRILLATDAASEGIDLQNHCHRIIHFEIPWNPNRLEQRNGRVDRHGQKASEVLIYHFVGKGYEERLKAYDQGNLDAIRPGEFEGDIEFLMIAARKVDSIRTDLGKVGPVIAQQVEDAMLGRRTLLDTKGAEEQAKPINRMFRMQRELQKDIEKITEQLTATKRELRFSPESTHAVVEVALELAGQIPLQEARLDGIWPDPSGRRTSCPVFRLPALRGSWARSAEGLEHPHTREIRPITFDHEVAALAGDKVVLCHLNHRLVQMSLHLLRAEVWSQQGRKKLNRVTARLAPSHILEVPAVIAHARLVVVGGDHQRLHEEIIQAGGLIREGRFNRMNVTQVAEALDSALDIEPADSMKERFQNLWPKIEPALTQALEARMRERTKNLEDLMLERAEKEAENIRSILLELERSIRTELKQAAPAIEQAKFDWAKDEASQLERNIDSLHRRLEQIPSEIEMETELILNRYANPEPRMFPAAVTFLVPERMANG